MLKMQRLTLGEVLEVLDQALQTQPSNLYREILLFQQEKEIAPPTDVVSEASFNALCRIKEKD